MLTVMPETNELRAYELPIDISAAAVDDLRDRLRRTRWPDAVEGAGWDYGLDVEVLRPIVSYWAEEFDWHAQQRRLNAFPHFRAVVEGIGIHYLHARGRGPHPMPLLITHGWPGSFAEMLALIPLLTDPAAHGGSADDAFDVVVPSMPGFGFSDRATRPGMNTWRIAELLGDLMRGLGYDRYGVQGGDFGAAISSRLGWTRPDEVIGMHLNYIPGSYAPPTGEGQRPLDRDERAFLLAADAWVASDYAYGHLQKTTPQTAAVALNDSPAGLAGWILEKFRGWADCGGDLNRLPIDELLVNVSIYWFTETIGSSMRLYLESAKRPFRFAPGERIAVPCGIAHFPLEAPFPPRSWIERVYDVVHWTDMPRGGHFAAMEEPELLAEDVRKFFRSLRSAATKLPL
jgi:pimeloyl-ACP methyl ester carboxylesterase